MIPLSRPRLVAVVFVSSVACLVSSGMLGATRLSQAAGVNLDHLIPREKWEGAGLTKLSTTEQETLAHEITALLGARPSMESSTPAAKDRSQWRRLERKMPKDEVKKLLGDPVRISVSRFYEVWFYDGGSVTFNGKGHVDSWSEP